MEDWEELEKFSKSKKSPIGYLVRQGSSLGLPLMRVVLGGGREREVGMRQHGRKKEMEGREQGGREGKGEGRRKGGQMEWEKFLFPVW